MTDNLSRTNMSFSNPLIQKLAGAIFRVSCCLLLQLCAHLQLRKQFIAIRQKWFSFCLSQQPTFHIKFSELIAPMQVFAG